MKPKNFKLLAIFVPISLFWGMMGTLLGLVGLGMPLWYAYGGTVVAGFLAAWLGFGIIGQIFEE